MRIRPVIIIALLLVALYGCKSVEPAKEPDLLKMPDTFFTSADSGTQQLVDWKSYFQDSSLIVLVEEAIRNSPDMAIALQRIRIAEADVRLKKNMLLPSINGVATAGQQKFGKYTMDGVGNYDTNFSPNIEEEQKMPVNLPEYYVGVQTSWEIDVWKKLRNRKKAALLRFLAEKEGRHLVVTELVAVIARSYFQLVALDNTLSIIRETIGLQEQALSIIRLQKEAGEVNELAVKQFEALLLNSRSLETETIQNINIHENNINLLCGRFYMPIARTSAFPEKNIGSLVRNGIPSDLLRNRPDIRQAEQLLKSRRADLLAARAAFFPSFSVNGALGYQAFNPAFLLSTPASIAYGIFGNMVMPLVNRAAIKAEFKTAGAARMEAFYVYQKSILQGYTEVNIELSNIKNLAAIQQLREEQVNTLATAVEISSDLFRTARATYFEVLVTQQNALSSRLELIDVKRRQLMASVNLYKALGGGWQ